MKALLIPAAGRPRVVDQNGLEDLQSLVGGLIQLVPIQPETIAVYVDEEGMLKGRIPNIIATAMAGQPIAGDAVVCGFDVAGGEDLDVPVDFVEGLMEVIA